MTEWFAPEMGRWFTFLSLLSLLALTAPWVARGRHKTLVTSLFFGGLALGCLFLGAGVIARLVEQPDYVVKILTRTGVVVTVVFGVTLGVVFKGYKDAEERRMLARDI